MAAKPKTLTPKQAQRVLDWAQNLLGLQDWEIDFAFTDNPPAWVGKIGGEAAARAQSNPERKYARVWVSPTRAVEPRIEEQVDSICHEVLEILWADTATPAETPQQHSAIYCLARALAKAYRAGVKP